MRPWVRRSLGCLVMACLVLLAGALLVRYLGRRWDPFYYGKPVSEWSHQAAFADDPPDRREAVGVLRDALRSERISPYVLLRGCFDLHTDERQLPPEVVPLLLEASRSEDLTMRSYGVALLPSAGREAIPAMVEVLRTSPYPDVRARAAEDLGDYFGPQAREAIPALKGALRDEDRAVRKAASDALRKVLGQARRS